MTRPQEATRSTGAASSDAGIVVSPHHLATAAGVSILRTGGSAVDAAVAVNAALAVVLPDTCGPGGDLFALIHEPGIAQPAALNASGSAGSGMTADDMRSRGHGEIPRRSPWSVTVPGCVDGWEALVARFGRIPLADSLAPAAELAAEGFVVSDELATSLASIEPLVGGQASASELFPDGAPTEGDVIRRPDFAATLTATGSDGREGFFSGPVGAGIIAASAGAIVREDLAEKQAVWVEPSSIEVFGVTGWTIPPNSQGYLALATLWIFEYLGPPSDPNDPLYHHLLIEAYRSVAWERADTVSDPSTARLSPEELLDPNRLALRASNISPTRTTRWPMPNQVPGGTAAMTVIDSTGLGISLIQSNFAGIGSGLSAGSTGVWLHNRGAGFNLIPGHPNEYAPHRRPLHTLSPATWSRNGNLDLLLGTRGGNQQPQFLAQVAAHHYHASVCIDDAQMEPRWKMGQPFPGSDSAVHVESRTAPVVVTGLQELGHHVEIAGAFEPDWGPVSVIDANDRCRSTGLARDHRPRTFRKGSADPRISTSAAQVIEPPRAPSEDPQDW